MKIIGIMMVFNCDEVVLDALKDIDGKVDEIHCYDGRWAYMRNITATHSTDRTEEIITEFAKTSKSKTIYEKLPAGLWESDARTMSLKNVAIGDWVFVFDSDERIVKWNDNIRSELEQSDRPCYAIHWDGVFFSVCRFFKKIEGIKYRLSDRVCSPQFGTYNEYLKKNSAWIGIIIHHNSIPRKIPRASSSSQRPHP